MKLNRRDLFRLPLARVEALSGRPAEPRVPGPPPPLPPATVLGAGPHEITESPVTDWSLAARMRGRWPVLWVHVGGMEHAPTLEALRAAFGASAPVAERILDPRARASLERFDDHLLLLVPFGAGEGGAGLGRAAVLLGADHLATFDSGARDRFGALREQLRSPYSRLRGGGAAAAGLAAIEAAIGALAEAASSAAERVDEARDASGAPERLRALRAELRAVERALLPLPAGLLAAAAAPEPLLPPSSPPRLRALAERVEAAIESVGAAREAAALLGEAVLADAQARLEARVRMLTGLVALSLSLIGAIAIAGCILLQLA